MGIMYKLMKHRNLSTDLSNTHTNVNVKSDRNRLITIEGNIIDSTESVAEDSSVEVLSNKNMDSNLDKQFTAEHIIQLCKFLAEKSKRNKNLYKQQQSPKKLTKSKQTQFQFEAMDEYNDNEDDEVDFYQNEALPLLNKQRLQHQQQQQQRNFTDEEDDECEEEKTSTVLSTRLSPDINSLNISSNTTTSVTSCALQHHQQQQQQQQIFNYQHHQQQQQQQHHQHQPQNQGKRDILLKIRRQIFERKRLRENGAFEPQALNNSQVWRPW
ncbi:ras-interacting protein RIP3-like [Lucilia sericata]|uniref:ras-interacting protein RIP3-like n=1 Tax=Lucilia sericata TaxID=13632 RepID=UPI0018A84DF9|nr:ras-interacting protein RIP3-like [Lucilia sericata]